MEIQSLSIKIHNKVVYNPWLKLLTAIIRGLLAIGFILPGLKKVAGIPFAAGLPTSEPIGYFFDGFFQATEFYFFVGAIQVIAGILLLFPATTALGTMFYLPVILNIFIITIAFDFSGTWIITSLMLLANFYLLCWEFDKWQALIPGFDKSSFQIVNNHLGFIPTIIASGLTGLLAVGIIYIILGIIENNNIIYPILITAISLLTSSYLLFKYRSKYVLN